MKRVVIFANGEVGDLRKQSSEIKPDDLVLCADAGAAHAVHAGIIPHVVIGDFDSLRLHHEALDLLRSHNVTFVKYPVDKDSTDLELALDYAKEAGASEVVIFCAFGARLDHLLGNIFLACLQKYSSLRIRLSDGRQEARLLIGPGHENIYGNAGDIISLIPLSSSVEGVVLMGSKWPLENASLHFGSSLSLSNSFVEAKVQVSLKKGFLLVVSMANESRE